MRTKSPPCTRRESVGEHFSEFNSAHRACALGNVASPARLPDPVVRVAPDAPRTVHDSSGKCKREYCHNL